MMRMTEDLPSSFLHFPPKHSLSPSSTRFPLSFRESQVSRLSLSPFFKAEHQRAPSTYISTSISSLKPGCDNTQPLINDRFQDVQNFRMPLPIMVSELLAPPKLWRFTGFLSSIVGFSCYALSPSFKYLFGKWNPLNIAIYTVFTLLIFLLMLFVNKWKRLARTFLLKAHVGFLVLMLISLYSFFEGRSEETSKEKAYGSILSLISCGAFALMSMSLARQLELGVEVGMFNFFLGCFLVTVTKMNFKLAPVAAIFCYLLVNFRSGNRIAGYHQGL